MKPDLHDIAPIDHVAHARRGGDYTFLGWGTFQADTEVHRDYDTMSVYLSEDGLLCIRPRAEFQDGRFAPRRPSGPSPWQQLVARMRQASASEMPELLAQAEELACRSVVLDDNALLSGQGAFEAARERRSASGSKP